MAAMPHCSITFRVDRQTVPSGRVVEPCLPVSIAPHQEAVSERVNDAPDLGERP